MADDGSVVTVVPVLLAAEEGETIIVGTMGTEAEAASTALACE